MNNNKGMALVTVLLTIVVTMILLGTLTSIILSTGEQTQRTQENIQADSLAMMGQEYIVSSFQVAAERAAAQEDEPVDVKMNGWAVKHASTERSLGEGSYKVEVPCSVPDAESEPCPDSESNNVSEEVMTYSYSSTGIVNGQEEIITGELSVTEEVTEISWQDRIINEKNNIENSFTEEDQIDACDGTKNNDDFESGDYWLTLESCKKGPNENLTFEDRSRVWLEGSLEMKGNNRMTINGFAYFDLADLYMNGGNTIIVNGDAFIEVGNLNVDMKNNTGISISGDAYFENADPGTLSELNICVDGNTNVENIPSCEE
ncbi:hypothetical protein [Salimicrobium flavidum]|uniref:PilX N-terminal n=1 Tax=Salimicrobium flavidum TaxID=570947 RepID=A0A1N7JMY1_9BACI|nr:hypothetical protein [Salimicrobium flavidum]SIS50719.1 hypothetical protein SAMN05421687_10714 [Salimicrobium flavidum]